MFSSIDSIVEMFPHRSIDPIVGQMNYETLSEVHLKLNTNAASVHSYLGYGLLGLLYPTVTPAVYNTRLAVPFVTPNHPGPTTTVPENSTSLQISKIHRQFNQATAFYKEYNDTNKSLKSLLILAVDNTYIRDLKDKYTGYANATTLRMPTHIYNSYAKITPLDLEQNDTRMKTD